MTGLLADRVVLVSGTGPGLGTEVARLVLRQGGRVAMADRLPAVAGVRAALDPAGDRSGAWELDITDAGRCAEVVAAVEQRFGRLDAVVHVAALDHATGGLLDGGLDDWEDMARVNVRGTLQLTREAVPALARAGGGAVVVIGAGAATTPDDRYPMLTYAASKGALVTAAWHLSRELGPLGIRVNTIHPVYKWGVTLEAALARKAEEEGVDVDVVVTSITDRLALGRMATDEDIAGAVAFFCSELSRAVTGQTLYVDGGQVLH